MLRSTLTRVLALVICLGLVGALFAADGVVVNYDKGKLTVTVDGKEKVVDLKGVKVIGADGQPVKGKDTATVLTKNTKVEIVEKDGKVAEIKIKK
jgi:hypothetical protein